MKKFIAILLLSIICSCVWAQDVIITKEGDVMNVFEVEIGAKTIFYKTESTETAPILKMNKADVYMVKFADGTKQIIEGESTSATSQHQASTTMTSTDLGKSSEASLASNKQKIDAINEAKAFYCDKESDKEANRTYGLLGITDNSIVENDDIELSFQIKSTHSDQLYDISTDFCNQAMLVNVKNKTDRTIYLDLGNSFFVREGNTSPYYVPSVTSTSQSSTTGGSVNLGAITGAMGIGGAANTLANGINVGGGSSKGTTNITYSQRVIPIPPMASVDLSPQLLFVDGLPNISIFGTRYHTIPSFYFGENSQLITGHSFFYPTENNPLTYTVRVAYSITEDCSSLASVYTNFYLKQLIGFRASKWLGWNQSPLNGSIYGWQNSLGFIGGVKLESSTWNGCQALSSNPYKIFPTGTSTQEP